MNAIVLVKQVPDITHIPEEAWDTQRGTLRRAALDAVTNPLDLHALALACDLKDTTGSGRVVALTMGPAQAREALAECLARGADETVHLMDPAFSGADTCATAYALGLAVRRIAREVFRGEPYVILAGMQSVDGDTAQVPSQLAEELGIPQAAYVRSLLYDPRRGLEVVRIGPSGTETLLIDPLPALLTVTECARIRFRSFERAHRSWGRGVLTWGAGDIGADMTRIGFHGSRTWVCQVQLAGSQHDRTKKTVEDLDKFLGHLEREYHSLSSESVARESSYVLGSRSPFYQGDVWVLAEHRDGVILDVSLELLGKARDLAGALGVRVGAVLLGRDERSFANDLFSAGADRIYHADDLGLSGLPILPSTRVVADLLVERHPQIMLFGATPFGRELAPRVAYRLGAGLTADCTGLDLCDQTFAGVSYVAALRQVRPALGGNIMATILSKNTFCQMASVRPGVFPLPVFERSRRGDVEMVPVNPRPGDLSVRVLSRERSVFEAPLKTAEIIVSGGRGMGSRRDLEEALKPLAAALSAWLGGKAEIAGSRRAVDEGFLGRDRQVGQTGQTVRPRLYVAVGISGAVQHITGMHQARAVVAVNPDPHANIFRHADWALVGPWQNEVPRLL
ncbi:MAG: hypothetical protein GX606_03890, partial [Elusimicrobia bacterium]|nr:hypothetical protein [Elusimicrobiota bacterium]